MNLVPDRPAPPPWAADVMSALAGVRPVPLPNLAATAGVAPGFVQTFLERHPHALLTDDGWIDALRLFDGVWFTHELSEVERDVGLLSADDALTVLAVLAAEGLPLAADGARAASEVVGKALPDLPPRLAGDLPAGQGLIGQALVGPVGWLDPYRAGGLLRLRLCDGHLEIGVTRPSAEPSRWVAEVRVAGVVAAEDALDRYPESADHKAPTADLARLIAELLLAFPALGAAPLPPLRPVLLGGLTTAEEVVRYVADAAGREGRRRRASRAGGDPRRHAMASRALGRGGQAAAHGRGLAPSRGRDPGRHDFA